MLWGIITWNRVNLLFFIMLAASLFTVLAGLSTVPMVALRYWLLPREMFTLPLDFVPKSVQTSSGSSVATPHLVALLDLSSIDLVSWHDYSIDLELTLPRSPPNIELGNFMIRGSLNQRDWKKSSLPSADDTDTVERMGIMPYNSDFVEKMGRVIFSPFYVFGLLSEHSIINVPLWRVAQRPRTTHPHLLLTLPPTAMVSQASLIFNVKLSGIRWLLQKYPISTFLIGTSTVLTTALVTIAALLSIAYSKVQSSAIIQKYPSPNSLRLDLQDKKAKDETILSQILPSTHFGTNKITKHSEMATPIKEKIDKQKRKTPNKNENQSVDIQELFNQSSGFLTPEYT